MADPALAIEGIEKHYRQAGVDLHILRGVSLTLNVGERVALLGPSGSGKTTLLQIIGLLDRPDAGSIRVTGRELNKADEGLRTQMRREKLGFVYQFHHLLPEFSALENVMMPARWQGKPTNEAKDAAMELLKSLGVAERASHRPAQLSGGEQQRVAIARALANKPAVLLADEPTGNLDPDTAERVMEVMHAAVAKTGCAMLMVTHNHVLAQRMDQVYHMDSGKVARGA